VNPGPKRKDDGTTAPSRSSAFSRRNGEIRRVGVFAAMLAAVAMLFVGLFYVWTRMQLVQIGYEISAMESKSRELKKRKQELLLEIASLQSPEELAAKAKKTAGLVFPPMGKVVHVP
jgi:cell division protein FtsL